MRITSGKYKNKILRYHGTIRPTMEIGRKALFDILRDAVLGKEFWDLFSGTGAVGFEALSRGASLVEFADQDPDNCKFIRDFLKEIGQEPGHVYCGDSLKFISSRTQGNPEIIFADPPYGFSEWESFFKIIYSKYLTGMFQPRLQIIIEVDKKEKPKEPENFIETDSRNYGKSSFIFYKIRTTL